jgi:hypothetical protein
MTIEKIRELYNAQPLIIHLTDGRRIPVRHPDFVATAPSGRTVIVYQPDDSHNTIVLLLVTDLEVSARGNGSRARRRSR